VSAVATATPAANERGVSAAAVLRSALEPIGGRGGGKDDIAQGGGTAVDGIDEALSSVTGAVARQLTG
jgi:alanyl-tRNA synthetase